MRIVLCPLEVPGRIAAIVAGLPHKRAHLIAGEVPLNSAIFGVALVSQKDRGDFRMVIREPLGALYLKGKASTALGVPAPHRLNGKGGLTSAIARKDEMPPIVLAGVTVADEGEAVMPLARNWIGML